MLRLLVVEFERVFETSRNDFSCSEYWFWILETLISGYRVNPRIRYVSVEVFIGYYFSAFGVSRMSQKLVQLPYKSAHFVSEVVLKNSLQ